ncbi:MAG: HAD family hydrolase [Kiritimatiellia bacterium]|jgi:beta-phosphoglucomutase
MAASPWRGVLFDMDGVLCDSEPFIREAARAMFRERHGVDIPDEAFYPFVGMGENRFLGGPAEERGIPFDPIADKARCYELYLELIRDRMPPMNGAHDFARACLDRGCRLAVASSADFVKVSGNIAQIGMAEGFFDAVVDGTMVTRHKPAPDLFLLAAGRLGLPPEHCLVIEDAPAGLQAARTAGCRALGILSSFDGQTLRDAGADWVAQDLADAMTLLPAIAGSFRAAPSP